MLSKEQKKQLYELRRQKKQRGNNNRNANSAIVGEQMNLISSMVRSINDRITMPPPAPVPAPPVVTSPAASSSTTPTSTATPTYPSGWPLH